MTVNKRKKNSRLRASHTHGWGSKKKHRGSGHRGGRGRAGSGKRADAKKPSIWKDIHYFGKHGFKPQGVRDTPVIINLRTMEDQIEQFLKDGTATSSGGEIKINLAKAGFTKLLSSGKARRAYIITIAHASPQALEKIQKAGGSITNS